MCIEIHQTPPPNVMRIVPTNYLNYPETTSSHLQNGWLEYEDVSFFGARLIFRGKQSPKVILKPPKKGDMTWIGLG